LGYLHHQAQCRECRALHLVRRAPAPVTIREGGPTESLADTMARAVGISTTELRAKLWLLAGSS
jgi:hypothetical protein